MKKMFRIVPVLLLLPAMCQALEATSVASSENPIKALAEELERMKGATPVKIQLGRIPSLWKQLPEPHKSAVKNDVICLACAGFLFLDDMSMFEKSRSAISDMEAFIQETTDVCTECEGTGKIKFRCPSCGGSGTCSRCQGRGGMGGARLRGMGSAATMSCPSCHGSGRCSECSNGMKEGIHAACNGSGRAVSKGKCRKAFATHRSQAVQYLQVEINRMKEEAFAAEQRAKGLVLRDGKWLTKTEIAEVDRRAENERRLAEERRKEAARKEEEEKRLAAEKRRKDEEFAASQRAKGLVLYDGEWLTQEELTEVKRKEKFVRLLMDKSRYNRMFEVLQVFDDGQALCVDLETKNVFCLHFNQSINRTVADGNRYRNNLYWCGTYTYTTVQNAQKRVNLYAIDLEEAVFEARRQGYDQE